MSSTIHLTAHRMRALRQIIDSICNVIGVTQIDGYLEQGLLILDATQQKRLNAVILRAKIDIERVVERIHGYCPGSSETIQFIENELRTVRVKKYGDFTQIRLADLLIAIDDVLKNP